MSFTRDVVIVGGCGRVGLPLGLVLADAGLSVTLYDRQPERGRPCPRGQDAVLGAGRRRAARAADRDRPPRRDRRRQVGRPRPSTSCWSSARRSTSTSTPTRSSCCSRSRACSTSSATVSTCAAQHRVPGCHRDGREAAHRGQAHDRRVVLSRADRRRARRSRSSARCRRSSPAAPSARCAAPTRSSRGSRRRSCISRRRRGRAREAVREHVALHPVRGREPAVHDRQRLRSRLRQDPRRA